MQRCGSEWYYGSGVYWTGQDGAGWMDGWMDGTW